VAKSVPFWFFINSKTY